MFIEPGRAISASSCVTVYTVGNVKELDDAPTYVAVDGGMSDNIRAALYDASYTAILASRSGDSATWDCRVAGKHCDAGDIVVSDVALPRDIRAHDLIAVPNTGAYCRSLANNYNLIPKPPIVLVDAGGASVLERRQTIEDLLVLDTGGDL